jgi:Ca2+-binding RTX toxin-like protein
MRTWLKGISALGAMALTGLLLAAPAMAEVKRGTGGPDRINGTDGHDEIYGFGGNDIIDGRGGNDHPLDGGAGVDRIEGGPGNDRIHGGPGSDGYFGLGLGGCKWNMNTWHLPPACSLEGGQGDDVIHGDRGSNFIVGGAGRDVLHMDEAGNIWSYGDGAADVVYGSGHLGHYCFVDYLDSVANCEAFYTDSSGVIGRHPDSLP